MTYIDALFATRLAYSNSSNSIIGERYVTPEGPHGPLIVMH